MESWNGSTPALATTERLVLHPVVAVTGSRGADELYILFEFFPNTKGFEFHPRTR